METASLWFARLDSGSADIDAFEAWRDADPRHQAAFARVAGVGFQLDRLRKFHAPAETTKSNAKPSRRALITGAAAGIGAVSVVAATLSMALSRVSAATKVGESRSVLLPDGGQIALNTDSKAAWKFNDHKREIWLERGEIALTVPHDSRPCLLFGGENVVQIASGKVNARLRGKALDLTVVEGICSLSNPSNSSPGSSPTARLPLKAGQAALIQPKQIHVRSVDEGDMHFVTSWRDGELIFNGQTLGAAIAEYNRYLPNKITILDASLENIRLGGRFKTRDPAEFLASLNAGFGIHVARDESGAVLLSK